MAASVIAIALAALVLAACAAAAPPKPPPPHVWHARLLPYLQPDVVGTPPAAPVPRITVVPAKPNPGGPVHHVPSPAPMPSH